MVEINGKYYNETQIVSIVYYKFGEREGSIVKEVKKKKSYKNKFFGISFGLSYTVEDELVYKSHWLDDNFLSLDETLNYVKRNDLPYVYCSETREFKLKPHVIVCLSTDLKVHKYFDTDDEMIAWFNYVKKQIDDVNSKVE